MKALLVLILLCSACAHEPYDPERAARMRAAGAAFSGLGNQLNEQNNDTSTCTYEQVGHQIVRRCY